MERAAGFPYSTRIPSMHIFPGQFWALFESKFSVMNCAAIYIWENWLGLFTCSCNNAGNDTGHHTRNTKINESQSSCSWSSYNTQYEQNNKSSHWLRLLPLNFIRQLWKMWFQPCFKSVFHKRIKILDWICFFHFISTRPENTCSQR